MSCLLSVKECGMISIGVIGVGRWGPNILRNLYSMEDVTVSIVADLDPKRLEQINKRFPSIKTTTNPEDIVNNSAIDCSVICTPVSTHFELAQKALLTGQHVFAEKPLAESTEQCQQLLEIAEKKNKILFVGHTFKFNAGIIAAKKYIDSGELGKIYLMDATRTNLGPVRYDTNALWDLAAHDISIFSYWLGTTPLNVSARGGCFLNEKIEDVVYATFEYPDEVIAHVHASWLNPRKIREITIVGEKKMLIWNDMNLSEPIRVYNQGFNVEEDYQDAFESFRLSIREGEVIIPNIKLNEPLMQECLHFVECVQNGTQPLTDGKDGLNVVKALQASTASMKDNSRSVRID
jgi:predicted dehydrogenase